MNTPNRLLVRQGTWPPLQAEKEKRTKSDQPGSLESDVGERNPDGDVSIAKRGKKTPERCPESAVEGGGGESHGKESLSMPGWSSKRSGEGRAEPPLVVLGQHKHIPKNGRCG